MLMSQAGASLGWGGPSMSKSLPAEELVVLPWSVCPQTCGFACVLQPLEEGGLNVGQHTLLGLTCKHSFETHEYTESVTACPDTVASIESGEYLQHICQEHEHSSRLHAQPRLACRSGKVLVE
jgi:hypothetical protein